MTDTAIVESIVVKWKIPEPESDKVTLLFLNLAHDFFGCDGYYVHDDEDYVDATEFDGELVPVVNKRLEIFPRDDAFSYDPYDVRDSFNNLADSLKCVYECDVWFAYIPPPDSWSLSHLGPECEDF